MGESYKKRYLCPVEFVELLGEYQELFVILAQTTDHYIAINKIAKAGLTFEDKNVFEHKANDLIIAIQHIHNYTGQLLNEIRNNLHNYEEKNDAIVN